MITVRKADERGHFDFGWLNTYHTFSFSDYYDPKYMGFRNLRVINEDRVQSGQGFGTHPHRDMEIISYVLEGGLAHKDSMGNGSSITPGEIQRMSAGTGVTHSEFNHSKDELVHFLQIWILPDEKGIKPDYEQKFFAPEDKHNTLKLVVSPDGENGSVKINSNSKVYASLLDAGQTVTYTLPEGRYGWVQVARGSVTLNGQQLNVSDGAAISAENSLNIAATEDAEILLFDLA